MTEPRIHVFDSASEVMRYLSDWLLDCAMDDIADHGSSAWALSGGSTPTPLYRLLASSTRVPWPSIYLYLVDERNVYSTDPLSNFRMIEESLLGRIPATPARVYPWETPANPPYALAHYRQDLSRLPRRDGYPLLDLALQGMGDDGHTASVFPNSPQEGATGWVASGPGPGADRLTLTLPLLARARRTIFLVTGQQKAHRVFECIKERDLRLPAAWLSEHAQEAHWFLDKDAAREL